MGVGKLRIIDRDVIELSNLHRQTMFDDSDVEQIKVEVAARKLQKLNPDVQIEALLLSVNDYNAIEVVDGCDVVIGSRFLNGKSNSPKYRNTGIRIITKAFNIGTKFKVTDAQSGFRAYLKKAIQEINPTEKKMSVSTEILQKTSNKGLTLAKVPISVSCDKDTSEQNPVPHRVSVLMNTLKFISVKHLLPFYGSPGNLIHCRFSYGRNFFGHI